MTRLLTADEAAAILGVSPSLVLALARSDDLPHVRIGRLVRIPDEALERWIAERTRYPGRHAEEASERRGLDLPGPRRPAPPPVGGDRRRRVARRTARPTDPLRVVAGGG